MEGPFITRAEAKRVDQTAIDDLGFPGIVLMENAGRGCVDFLQGLAGDEAGQSGPVLIACGGGNNAGDGFVIARHLALRGVACRVVLAADPTKLSGDALTAYRMMQPCGVRTLPLADLPPDAIPVALDSFAADCRLLIDALLGTGASGNPRPPFDAVINWMNAQVATRVAIDLPSGLDCDTGQSGDPTFHADHTCTFVAAKAGFQEPGAKDHIGQVHVVSIGLPNGRSASRTEEQAQYRKVDEALRYRPHSEPYELRSTNPRHQIALALRHRPLVLPLLLATLCVDAVIAWSGDTDDYLFWGIVLPQLGLLAIWTAERMRSWLWRFPLSAACVISLAIVKERGVRSDAVTVLIGYYLIVLVAAFLIRLAVGLVRPNSPSVMSKAPRFTTWQLLVVMTITAPLAAAARFIDWPVGWDEAPILISFVAMPLVVWFCMTRVRNAWAGLLIAVAAIGFFEWVVALKEGPDLLGWMLTQACVSAVWIGAIRLEPYFRRRVAARRRRNAQRAFPADIEPRYNRAP